jgi:hypothetical protein
MVDDPQHIDVASSRISPRESTWSLRAASCLDNSVIGCIESNKAWIYNQRSGTEDDWRTYLPLIWEISMDVKTCQYEPKETEK